MSKCLCMQLAGRINPNCPEHGDAAAPAIIAAASASDVEMRQTTARAAQRRIEMKTVKPSEMVEGRWYTFGDGFSTYQFRGGSLYYNGEDKQDGLPAGMHECWKRGKPPGGEIADMGVSDESKSPGQMIVGHSYDVMHGNGQWVSMGRYNGLSPNGGGLVRFAGTLVDVDMGGNRWRETEHSPQSLSDRWHAEAKDKWGVLAKEHHADGNVAAEGRCIGRSLQLMACADRLKREQGKHRVSGKGVLTTKVDDMEVGEVFGILVDDNGITTTDQLRNRLHIAQTHHDLQMRTKRAEQELAKLLAHQSPESNMLRVLPEQMVVGRRYVMRDDEPMTLLRREGAEGYFDDEIRDGIESDPIDEKPWCLDVNDWYEVGESFTGTDRSEEKPPQRGPAITAEPWAGDDT